MEVLSREQTLFLENTDFDECKCDVISHYVHMSGGGQGAV